MLHFTLHTHSQAFIDSEHANQNTWISWNWNENHSKIPHILICVTALTARPLFVHDFSGTGAPFEMHQFLCYESKQKMKYGWKREKKLGTREEKKDWIAIFTIRVRPMQSFNIHNIFFPYLAIAFTVHNFDLLATSLYHHWIYLKWLKAFDAYHSTEWTLNILN